MGENLSYEQMKARLEKLERLVKQFHESRGSKNIGIAYYKMIEFAGVFEFMGMPLNDVKPPDTTQLHDLALPVLKK